MADQVGGVVGDYPCTLHLCTLTIIGVIQCLLTYNTNNAQLLTVMFEWPGKMSIKSKHCMPPTHTEMYHSDRDVELIIFNRAIIYNDATIIIIQSGIIIFHIEFIVVLFIFIIAGFVFVGVNATVHVVIID